MTNDTTPTPATTADPWPTDIQLLLPLAARLLKQYARFMENNNFPLTANEARDLAAALAAAAQPAPIGADAERAAFDRWRAAELPAGCVSDMERGWMTRAALASAAPPATVPPGYVLTPVEPSDKMVQAALHIDLSYMPGQDGADRAAVYRAMLAAATKAAPALQYDAATGTFEGETLPQAAENWAQWCERRCLGGLPEFLRFVGSSMTRAAAQPAAAPAAVAVPGGIAAYRISDPTEPDLGHWLSEEPGPAWCKSEPLYTTALTTQAAPQPAVQQGDDFWPVDGNASRKQLIYQIGRMNYQLTALRQQNAGLVARVQRQAKALRNLQSAAAPAAQEDALDAAPTSEADTIAKLRARVQELEHAVRVRRMSRAKAKRQRKAAARQQEDALDAARYRWLRLCNLAKHPAVRDGFDLGGAHLDAAIDAARAAVNPTQGN